MARAPARKDAHVLSSKLALNINCGELVGLFNATGVDGAHPENRPVVGEYDHVRGCDETFLEAACLRLLTLSSGGVGLTGYSDVSQEGVGGATTSHRKRGRTEDVDDQEAACQLASEGGEEEEGESGAQECGEEEDEEAGTRQHTTQGMVIMSRMISTGDYKVCRLHDCTRVTVD